MIIKGTRAPTSKNKIPSTGAVLMSSQPPVRDSIKSGEKGLKNEVRIFYPGLLDPSQKQEQTVQSASNRIKKRTTVSSGPVSRPGQRQSQAVFRPTEFINSTGAPQGFSSIFDHGLLNQSNTVNNEPNDLKAVTGPGSEEEHSVIQTEKLMASTTHDKHGTAQQSGFSFLTNQRGKVGTQISGANPIQGLNGSVTLPKINTATRQKFSSVNRMNDFNAPVNGSVKGIGPGGMDLGSFFSQGSKSNLQSANPNQLLSDDKRDSNQENQMNNLNQQEAYSGFVNFNPDVDSRHMQVANHMQIEKNQTSTERVGHTHPNSGLPPTMKVKPNRVSRTAQNARMNQQKMKTSSSQKATGRHTGRKIGTGFQVQNIPKNLELKYRKDMQKLKFYQTLNNYPNQHLQQSLAPTQISNAAQAATQAYLSQPSQSGMNFSGLQNSKMNKQVVYQMHSGQLQLDFKQSESGPVLNKQAAATQAVAQIPVAKQGPDFSTKNHSMEQRLHSSQSPEKASPSVHTIQRTQAMVDKSLDTNTQQSLKKDGHAQTFKDKKAEKLESTTTTKLEHSAVQIRDIDQEILTQTELKDAKSEEKTSPPKEDNQFSDDTRTQGNFSYINNESKVTQPHAKSDLTEQKRSNSHFNKSKVSDPVKNKNQIRIEKIAFQAQQPTENSVMEVSDATGRGSLNLSPSIKQRGPNSNLQPVFSRVEQSSDGFRASQMASNYESSKPDDLDVLSKLNQDKRCNTAVQFMHRPKVGQPGSAAELEVLSNNLRVKQVQMMEKQECLQQKVRTAYGKFRVKKDAYENGEMVLAENMRDSRQSAIMFRNKVIKDTTTAGPGSKEDYNSNLSKADSLLKEHEHQHVIISDGITSHAFHSSSREVSTHRKPCERFIARGNKPPPQPFEEEQYDPTQHQALNNPAIMPNQMLEQIVTDSEYKHQSTMQLLPQSASDFQNRVFLENLQDTEGSAENRKMLGNLPQYLQENFEEEVSGINLGKLFSVYGPNSQQQKKRAKRDEQQKKRKLSSSRRNPFDNTIGVRHNKNVRSQDSLALGVKEKAGLLVPLQMNEPDQDNQTNHLQLLKSILYDGSLQEMVMQQHLQQNIDSESEEDEEPLVIKMLESQLNKKKTVKERLEMNKEVPASELQAEIKREHLKAKTVQELKKRHEASMERMAICQSLVDKIEHIQDRDEYEERRIMIQKEQLAQEQRANPFYMNLKAMKEAREKFMRDHAYMEKKLNNMLPCPIIDSTDQSQEGVTGLEDISEQKETINEQDPGFDVFKHTYVDIDESQIPKSNKSDAEEPPRQKQDIFCFYNLTVDLPVTFFKKLGDFTIVTEDKQFAIKEFILNTWPVLIRRKITFKIGWDSDKKIYNVILVGSESPVSKCCKMSLNFQFSADIGGKVICMEGLCSQNPVDQFPLQDRLLERLFVDVDDYRMKPKSVSYRYQKAVSHELAKRVNNGNFRYVNLQEIVTDPKFQQDHLKSTRIYPSKELMELLLTYSRDAKKNKMKTGTYDVTNDMNLLMDGLNNYNRFVSHENSIFLNDQAGVEYINLQTNPPMVSHHMHGQRPNIQFQIDPNFKAQSQEKQIDTQPIPADQFGTQISSGRDVNADPYYTKSSGHENSTLGITAADHGIAVSSQQDSMRERPHMAATLTETANADLGHVDGPSSYRPSESNNLGNVISTSPGTAIKIENPVLSDNLTPQQVSQM